MGLRVLRKLDKCWRGLALGELSRLGWRGSRKGMRGLMELLVTDWALERACSKERRMRSSSHSRILGD